MTISRRQLYAAGEPLGDSATRYEQRRLILGGGGGKSKPQENYKNLEGLYGEQTASARLLREQAEANLPSAVTAYVGEVNQALNPHYADTQSAMAAADMASANAMERSATNRELSAMGVNPNDARFVGANRAAETNNAARMAAGRNVARNEANKYQLAVAQDAVGTFTGQSNSASSQMSGATSGLSGLYSQQNATQQQQQQQRSQNVSNAVGGAMAAWSMFKDGGKVGLKTIERHAMGGSAGAQQKTMHGFFQPMQVAPPPQMASQPVQQQQGPSMAQTINAGKKVKGAADGSAAASNTDKIGRLAGKFSDNAGNQIQSQARGMNMSPTEAKEAASAYREAANTAASPEQAQSYLDAAANIEQGAGVEAASSTATSSTSGVGAAATEAGAATSAGTTGAATGTTGAATSAAAAPGSGLASIAPGVAGEVAGAASGLGSAGSTTAATLVGDAALTTAATQAGAAGAAATGTTAVGATAAGAAGATGLGAAGAMIGAAMPWVGAAMAVGSLLELWADGGEVGTQNDDAAKAQLQQATGAEHVNDLRPGGKVPGNWEGNKDTVPALLVEEEHVLNAEAAKLVGHAKLEAINKKGLAQRKQGKTPDQIRTIGLGALA